ncbi:MAG TPA: DUF4252 domain-containing protein [Bryobacteraceae bacterium]|nr:DUF4252 domain-containing protein [Bryobacteraceae bacterium]
MRLAILIIVAGLCPAGAQEIKLPPSVERLADKAEESVSVTLDSNMLRLLARFDDGSDADTRKMLSGVQSIFVRSFQFAFDGEYQAADVAAVRTQFQAAPWARIVGVRSKGIDGDVDVFFKDGGNGKLGGIVIISAEPRELTIVSITGSIEPRQLADLGGHFHIPRLEMLADSRRRDDK